MRRRRRLSVVSMLANLVIEASRFEAPARALDASTVVDHRTHACAPGCRFLTLGDGRVANTILEERNASSADITRCGSSAQRPDSKLPAHRRARYVCGNVEPSLSVLNGGQRAAKTKARSDGVTLH
jgi:hypothetical protein